MKEYKKSTHLQKDHKDEEPKLTPELASEEAVIMVRGTNMFGNPVFSYIKFTLKEFRRMRIAMESGEKFKPSDYGEVLVSGQGEPSDELKEEMRIKWGLVETDKPDPVQKKKEKENPTPDFSSVKPMEGLDKNVSEEIKKIGHEITNSNSK